MSTIRNEIEGFVYPLENKLLAKIEREGMETEFCGVKGFITDKDRFTTGAAFKCAVLLYLYKVRINASTEEVKTCEKRIDITLDLLLETGAKTWGKLDTLRALSALCKAGKMDVIKEKYIESLKKITDYSDFFDKNTMDVGALPTNYLHVAMACAGYRHILGWEDDSMMHKIPEVFIEKIKADSPYGWMDETKERYGRYDRYTLLISSEIADTYGNLGMEVPECIMKTLKMSADFMMFLANSKGDGITYGRSLSCHGDSAAMETIATALRLGLIEESKVPIALSYTMAICKKIRNFWFDKELGAINICLNGRVTNNYRSIQRILQVNLNTPIQMLNTLQRLEEAGLADTEVQETLPQFDFASYKVEFEPGTREIFAISNGVDVITIPFVGQGKHFKHASYFSIPFWNKHLEAPPELFLPVLLPMVKFKDGKTAMPVQYIEKIESRETESSLEIKGRYNTLCYMDGDLPEICNRASATLSYYADKDILKAEFVIDFKNKSEVESVEFCSTCKEVQVWGIEGENVNTEGKPEYDTPHGHRDYAMSYKLVPEENKIKFGYSIIR